MMYTKKCLTCGTEFSRPRNRQIYCSYKCIVKTESTRKKMSENNVGFSGRKHTAETLKNMSKSHSGSRHHMFGKKHSIETRDKISSSMSSLMNIEMREKISKTTREGMTKEVRQKISIRAKKSMTSERRAILSERAKQRILNTVGPWKDTSPELLMKKILSELNIYFVHQYIIRDIQHSYAADFFLPDYNIVIEVDGLYWHNYPEGRAIDKIRTEELKKNGYAVLRFWEKNFSKEVVEKNIRGAQYAIL